MVAWDGLQFPLPKAMEVVELHRGYVRLAGEGLSLELRFGPEKRPFDPHRDGRRLQRAARRHRTQRLAAVTADWSREDLAQLAGYAERLQSDVPVQLIDSARAGVEVLLNGLAPPPVRTDDAFVADWSDISPAMRSLSSA